MKKHIVATKSLTYNPARNFAQLPFEQFEVQKKVDLFKFPDYLYFKLFNKSHSFFPYFFQDFGLNKCEIAHFFNAVSLNNRPWFTTFEYYLPRWDEANGAFDLKSTYSQLVLKRLAHPSCKNLIAMSEFAKNAQTDVLSRCNAQLAQAILPKIEVIHPSQKLIIKNLAEKTTSPDFISFTIVGAAFFRKGGKEILRVFDRLLQKNYPIRLNIISKLEYGDYASKTDKQDLIDAQKVMAKHAKNIFLFGSLHNAQVMEILKATDITLLPSYEESYGYSVLEGQACGSPAITTNGTAFGEINNAQIGWLIDAPLGEHNRTAPKTDKQRQELSQTIEAQLEEIIIKIVHDRAQIAVKAQKCLQKIDEQHNVATQTQRIESLYRKALNG